MCYQVHAYLISFDKTGSKENQSKIGFQERMVWNGVLSAGDFLVSLIPVTLTPLLCHSVLLSVKSHWKPIIYICLSEYSLPYASVNQYLSDALDWVCFNHQYLPTTIISSVPFKFHKKNVSIFILLSILVVFSFCCKPYCMFLLKALFYVLLQMFTWSPKAIWTVEWTRFTTRPWLLLWSVLLAWYAGVYINYWRRH